MLEWGREKARRWYHKPRASSSRMAKELMSFIDEKKMDHIDYDYSKIEMYPDPKSKKTPTFRRFCRQWELLFDYADKITQDDGTGFPEDLVSSFQNKMKEVEKIINEDKGFWNKLREEVLPIYVHSKDYENVWKKRWKAVDLFYDPVGITVKTHKKVVDKNTGEIKERTLISQREIPAGIVIRIL